MTEATTALDTAYRALAWVGFGGLSGALAVLLFVWPAAVRQRRLALVALGGSTLLAVVTAGWLVARVALPTDLPRVEGAAAILRLAVLAAVGGYFTDLLDGPVRGGRRAGAFVAGLALTGTMLAGAAGGRPAQAAPAFTGDLFVAVAAAVLGACVVLLTVVLSGDARDEVPYVRARTAHTARTALGSTALVAAVHAIAAARSPWGFSGVMAVLEVLLVVVVVAAVLVLGRVLRGVERSAPPARVRVPAAAGATGQPVADRATEPVAEPVAELAAQPAAQPWSEPSPVQRRPALEVYEGPRRLVAAPDHEPVETDVPGVVVLPDTAAAAETAGDGAGAATAVEPVRHRRGAAAARARRRRYVAGVGPVELPEQAEPAPVTRTVRLAGGTDPIVAHAARRARRGRHQGLRPHHGQPARSAPRRSTASVSTSSRLQKANRTSVRPSSGSVQNTDTGTATTPISSRQPPAQVHPVGDAQRCDVGDHEVRAGRRVHGEPGRAQPVGRAGRACPAGSSRCRRRTRRAAPAPSRSPAGTVRR